MRLTHTITATTTITLKYLLFTVLNITQEMFFLLKYIIYILSTEFPLYFNMAPN